MGGWFEVVRRREGIEFFLFERQTAAVLRLKVENLCRQSGVGFVKEEM